MKKLVLAAAALGALLLAGVAGAVVSARIVTLRLGEQARIKDTGVYCLVERSTTGLRSFECASTDEEGPRPGSYGAFLNDSGLVVYRYDESRTARKVRQWTHAR
jgi:hypothetical protein